METREITHNAIDIAMSGKKNHFQKCFEFAKDFIKSCPTFTSEDIIDKYNENSSHIPNEPRVWGAVIRELQRMQLIIKAGVGVYKKPQGHGKPVNVWRSLVYVKNYSTLNKKTTNQLSLFA